MANRITVVIRAVADKATREVRGFRQAVSEADGAVGKMKAGSQSMGRTLRQNTGPALAVAGAAAVSFGQAAVAAASSLEESTNAVNVAFGESAEGVHELGESSVEAFGLSTRAFNEAAVAMSSFAKTIAGPGGDVAGTMDDLIGRATDFASVYNLDVADALQVFQSTLAGQTEPIRRYGHDVSAAAVEQYALSEGLVSSKDEMTEAIKVQARYGLLMRQTADTAGDFANTQDSLANQSRILTANVEELQAEIGRHLVPALAEATQNLNDMLDTADSLGLIDLGAQLREWSQDYNALSPNNAAIDNLREGIDLLNNRVTISSEHFEELAAAIDKYGENSAEAQAVDDKWTGQDKWDAFQEFIGTTEAMTEATEEFIEATEDQAEALRESADAINDQIRAQRSAVDSTFALRDAEDEFLSALEESQEALNEAGADMRARQQALDDTTEAAIGLADAELRVAEDTAEAAGETLTATQRQDMFNASLMRSAATASGPMRRAILDYVAAVNDLPSDVRTEIELALQRGDVDEANRLLDNASRTRQASIIADARVEAAEARINYTARDRTVNFVPGTMPRAGVPRAAYARGSQGTPPGAALVGERGPELVELPTGSRVHDAQRTRSMMSAGGGRSGNVIINMPAGARPEDVARAQRRYDRIQGSMP